MPSAYDDYFRPIVARWLELLREAEKAKKPFAEVAEQCMAFYSARNGFIFEKEFRQKFLGITNENQLPRHRLTFSKAYEYVSIFGPMLYWDNPQRNVKPRRLLQITPEQFGITPEMQQAWQQFQQASAQFQQAMQQYQQMLQQGPPMSAPPPRPEPGQPPQPPAPPAPWPPPAPQPPPPVDPATQQAMSLWDWSQQQMSQRAVADNIRCQLLEGWLNYTPTEIPHGGLATHSRLAIVEALVKGRGCLWSSPFMFDGSERALVGSFYDSVDNLFIDPDATSMADAKWIMQRVVAPTHQVEEEFSLTPGSLEGKGGSIVAAAGKMNPIGATASSGDQRKDKVGRSSELITYYKVWSKSGVGTKMLGGLDPEVRENLDRVSGKFVFLCVCDSVAYPLNLPADQLEAMTDEEVAKRLEWPYPCWKDDRWPCAILDFYPHPNRVWPIAPLAPALGELTFLQVIMSHLADRIVKSSRDFVAVLQSAGEEIEEQIKNGGDLTVLKLTEVHQNIGNVVQFLQQPSVNHDAWLIVDRVNALFERRTGLTDLMAGQANTQSRSAADANIKGQQINVRPEDMQRRVEEWMTDAAKLEKIATRWFIEPRDVELLFGPVGAYLWQTYITSTDPEVTIRETDCTIEPGSVRKPNKERDVQNMNTLAQFIGPILNQVYTQTGNPGPLTWLLTQLAKVYDIDINGLELPPPPPPPQPDPAQMQMQQQAQQMQQQAQQMDMAKRQMEMQGTQQKQQFDQQMLTTKGQYDGQRFQMELQKLAVELQLRQQEIEGKRLQSQAEMQRVILEQQQGQQDAQVNMQRAQVELSGDAAEIAIAERRAASEMEQKQLKAQQELAIAELKAQQNMQHLAQSQQVRTQQELFRDPIQRLFGPQSEG